MNGAREEFRVAIFDARSELVIQHSYVTCESQVIAYTGDTCSDDCAKRRVNFFLTTVLVVTTDPSGIQ